MSFFTWDRLWLVSGIIAVIFLVTGYLAYVDQPEMGASSDDLISFYDGDRTMILMATTMLGGGVLFLVWFAAAISSILHHAGRVGWATALTTASAAVGALFFVIIGLGAALAYSIAGSGNEGFVSGLNDLSWACLVMSAFPRAMFVMAASFGLWRAGIISTPLFVVGVAAVILEAASATTWANSGFWAPDGAYSQFISPAIFLVWTAGASGILLIPRPSTERAAEVERVAVAAPAW